MKILFDTSVLVAAIVEAHPMHSRALPWLQRAKEGEFEFLAVTHTLVELYAVLTALPLKPRIWPGTAWRLIHENVVTSAKIVSLSSADYTSTIKHVADSGISGSVIYDALIMKAALKSGADRLITFNADDFTRIWPEKADILSIP